LENIEAIEILTNHILRMEYGNAIFSQKHVAACRLAILALDQIKWIPVTHYLPEKGQKVKIRTTCEYYDAIYEPENPWLPWRLIDERDGSISPLYRRAEAVNEWSPANELSQSSPDAPVKEETE
jgi:hypothetical protein